MNEEDGIVASGKQFSQIRIKGGVMFGFNIARGPLTGQTAW
jgi:hypothetical protein